MHFAEFITKSAEDNTRQDKNPKKKGLNRLLTNRLIVIN